MNLIKSTARRILPFAAQALLNNLMVHPAAFVADLFQRSDPNIPPRGLMYVGSASRTEFKEVGEQYLRLFVELCSLKNDERILDIGSGAGRMAIPLTRYLSAAGSYDGVDIISSGIELCRRNITPRYPNFHFRHADIYNKTYNRKGKVAADAFQFPYDDQSFDFVFACSVFTHMLPDDLEHYVSETARTLSPGGQGFFTFFLMNDAARSQMAAGKASLDFAFSKGSYLTIDATSPEAAVAYEEDFVVALLANYGLRVRRPIRYGTWSGREDSPAYQDIVTVDQRLH